MHQASDKNRARVPGSYNNNDQMMKIRHQERELQNIRTCVQE